MSSGYVSEEKLLEVPAQMPPEADLADFLLANSIISDADLCKAISLQSGVPSALIDPRRVKQQVARTLPAHIGQRFGVVPYRVHSGRLHVACSRVPSSEVLEELRNFSRLPVEFQLVTNKTTTSFGRCFNLDIREYMKAAQKTRRRFSVVLIKPSHYDDDGYVIQWLRSPFRRIHWRC